MTIEEVVMLADRAERVKECADCIMDQATIIQEEQASLEAFGQAGNAESQANARTYNHRIVKAKATMRIACEQLRTALDLLDVSVP